MWKMTTFLGCTQLSFLTGFSRKWRGRKGKFPGLKPENGSCHANIQSEIANKNACNSTIKDESSRNLKVLLHKGWCQNWLLKFVGLDLSTNDLFSKTRSLALKPCSLHWPYGIIFGSLTFIAFRTQMRTPRSIFTVCVLELFPPLTDQPNKLLSKSVMMKEYRRHEIQMWSLPGNVMWKATVLRGVHVPQRERSTSYRYTKIQWWVAPKLPTAIKKKTLQADYILSRALSYLQRMLKGFQQLMVHEEERKRSLHRAPHVNAPISVPDGWKW